MQDEPAIFISYRRRDAGGHGRALHQYLSGRFGDDRVFFDGNTIESGESAGARWRAPPCYADPYPSPFFLRKISFRALAH